MSSFGRNYKLTIRSGENELVYEPPFQIRFHVDIWEGNAGSTAEITLYGVSRKSRGVIFRKFDKITLSAGYGKEAGLIFAGDISNIEMGREGPDSYIKFFARTTGEAQKFAYVSRVWGENTPQIDIIRDTAETLLMPVEIYGDFSDLPRAIKGRNICMSSVDCMNMLADLHGFSWFLGANRLIITRRTDPEKGEPTKENLPTHLVSASTGMIGTPQVFLQQIGVKVTLNPKVVPNDLMDLQAETRNFAFSGVYRLEMERDDSAGNGLYSVMGVQHKGDFSGDTWETSIAGVRKS